MRTNRTLGKKKRGIPRLLRFPHIVGAARELNVDRSSIYRALTGERPSMRLVAGYRAFVESKTRQ